MKNPVQIKNIEPFNQFFFLSCFYSALLSILEFYKIDPKFYIANAICVYNDTAYEGYKRIYPKPFFFQPQEGILNELGINCHTRQTVNHVVQDVIETLQAGSPVILSIDCFYEPIRQDFYQIKHWPHHLLIYGYDSEKQAFHLFEQDSLEQTLIQKKTLSASALEESYQGYIHHFKRRDDYAFFSFSKRTHVSSPYRIADRYKENLRLHAKQIECGLQALKRFVDECEYGLLDCTADTQKAFYLLDGFNRIIEYKKCLLYLLSQISGSSENIYLQNEKILLEWQKLRRIFGKLYYIDHYPIEKREKMKLSLNIICELEHNLYYA